MSLAKLLARGYKPAGKGKLKRPDGKIVSEARAVASAKRGGGKAARGGKAKSTGGIKSAYKKNAKEIATLNKQLSGVAARIPTRVLPFETAKYAPLRDQYAKILAKRNAAVQRQLKVEAQIRKLLGASS